MIFMFTAAEKSQLLGKELQAGSQKTNSLNLTVFKIMAAEGIKVPAWDAHTTQGNAWGRVSAVLLPNQVSVIALWQVINYDPIAGILPPVWETQMECLVPDLAQP